MYIFLHKYFNRLIIHQTLGLTIEGSCDGTYNSYGYLMSPNYPQYYENNLHCRWTIKASVGNIIKLKFLDFNTDSYTDKLYIYDGTNVHGQLLETISRSYHHPFASKTNNIYLNFATYYKLAFIIKVESIGKYT